MIPVSTAVDGGWEEGVGAAIGGLCICLAVNCNYDIGEEGDVGGCGQQIVLLR
jgi:hypothetical protein